MARHETRKATAVGRRETLARRTTRRVRYATREIDWQALAADVASETLEVTR